MSPYTWQELDELVAGALEIPVDERRAWIEERCLDRPELRDEARALLELEERSAEFLERPLLELDPEQVGAFRIVRRLSSGGSSFVYEAVPLAGGEPVALKVLRGGLFVDESQLRQARREVSVLARLNHPGIAQILEVGRTAEGRHFVAMELVRGASLAEHVTEARPSLDERLELFVQLCEAVHFAHERGVVHRDLKPSNVLVDEHGRPKLIDFGLARLTRAHWSASTLSRPGEILGTLPYMSPEQASGNSEAIDTRTDVYSLGVILYELVTGELPFEFAGMPPEEAIPVICGRAPDPPSSRRAGLRRDLDTIVLQALRKNRFERYASALDLADDVTRFLTGRAIVAREPGRVERLGTVLRENRLASAALLLALVSLALFGATTALNNRELRAENLRTSRAEERANDEANRARVTLDLLQDSLHRLSERRSASDDVTMRELLDEVALEAERLRDRPLESAELHHALGRSYASLGRYQDAAEHLRAHLDLLAVHGESQKARVHGYQGLGDVLANLARYEEAADAYEQGLALALGLPDQERVIATLESELSRVLRELGRAEEAREHATETLRLVETGPDDTQEVELEARARWSLGEVDGPEGLLREAIDRRIAEEGESLEVARSLGDLGVLLAQDGRPLEAREPMEQALAIHLLRQGATHPETVGARHNFATLLLELGSYQEARDELLLIRESWQELELTAHEDYASTLASLGAVSSGLRDLEAAERYMREALDAYRASASQRDDLLASHLSNLARALTDLGRTEEATELVQEALELRASAFGDGHPAVARSLAQLGQILFAEEELEAAEDTYREALAILAECLPTDDPELGYTHNDLGAVLHAAERFEEAEELYRSALDAARRSLGEEHPTTLHRMQNLGDLLVEADRPEEAELLLRTALAARRRSPGPQEPSTVSLATSLATCLTALGQDEEARSLLALSADADGRTD